MRRLRDYQRSKVYRAEDTAKARMKKIGIPVPRLESIPEIEAFLGKLVNSAWFLRRWELPKIVVSDGRGRRRACAYPEDCEVVFPRWSRDLLMILHELAHVVRGWASVPTSIAPELKHPHYNCKYESSHGRDFCKRYLELVGHCLGKDARRILKDAFKERRVRHRGTDYDWEQRRKRKYAARKHRQAMAVAAKENPDEDEGELYI